MKNTEVVAKDSAIKKSIDPQNNEFVDRKNEIKKSQQDENAWKTRMLKIHNKELTLKYPDPSMRTMHSEMNSETGSVTGYKIEGTGMGDNIIELEEGILVTLQEPVSILETHIGAGEAKEGDDTAGCVYLMSPTGEISFDLSKIKGMEGMEAAGSIDADGNPTVNLGMFQMVMNFNADGKMAYGVEISAYLRDSLKVKTKNEDGTQNQVELVQGEYQKPIAGDGMLKFADSYVSTQKGKGNAPQITEIHFQERKKMENENASESNQTKESYYYKAFAAQEVRLKNAKDNSENISADSAKTKIFGFPVELNQVSINDSTGTMNAENATLKWGNIALELKKIQLREKHKKVKTINTYKKSHDNDIKEILKISIMNRTTEKDVLKIEEGRTVIEEVDAEDGMGFESASLKLKDAEVELQNVSIKEEAIEAASAGMQYNHSKLELFKTNLAKGSEVVEAETGQMELYRHKLSMRGVTLGKELKLSSTTASAEIDNFFTVMTGFKYTEGGEATYDGGKVMVKLLFGKKEDEGSEIQKKQQYMMFSIGKGKYSGTFEEGTESTKFFATGNIEKKVVKEGTLVEEAVKPEKEGTTVEDVARPETGKNQEKISNKRRNLLNRLKEKWRNQEKDKEKRAPKIITKDREHETVQQEIVTLDGFAKVVNATFDFVKKDGETKGIGEGDIKFQDIPFCYDINDVIKKTETAFAPEEAVKGVEFTIDSDGNLNAVFKDDAEAEFNLKGVNGKENSGEGTIYAITLGDFSIQNGYLQAGSASLERGLTLEQAGAEDEKERLYMTEKAKKFFDCELTGSMVNESKKDGVELTTGGIEAHLEKAKLGKFGVSGFMGFLNGEVDFRGGEIAVSAEKAYEPEKLQESFFSLEKNTKGLDATIPTPIPGVGVAFNITPFVGISGAVGVGVKLGKAFDEWEKDSMELNGIVEGKGEAGITVGAGVNLGAGYIASVDLMLEGGLSASIEGTLEGSTAFKFNKEENAKKKMEQAEDLTFDGSLKGKLTGGVNLKSTAKLFFWKKQLFNFELWKKELGTIGIKGTGKKAKTATGLFEGWKITSGEFNASWLSHEITSKYFKKDNKGIKDNMISEQELETLVTNKSEEAKDAWAVLCKLQAQKADSDTAIIVSEEEKAALDTQIEDAKEKLAVKCDECLALLIPKKANLEEKLKEAKTKLTEVTKKAEEYAKAQGLAEDVFQKAQWGGFNKEKYALQALPESIEKPEILNSTDEKTVKSAEYKKKLKTHNELVKERNAKVEEIEKFNATQNANASIDLMITYMLGQVSKENIARMQQKHMEENHMGMEEYVEYLKKTKAEELQKKADKLKGEAKEKKEYDNSLELYKLELNLKHYDIDYYMRETHYANTVPEYKSQDNYYSMLNEDAIYIERMKPKTHWMDDHNTYVFERTKSHFPFKMRKMIDSNTKMKDILQYILEGEYTAEEKLNLIKKCFAGIIARKVSGDDSDSDMINWGKDVKEQFFKNMGTMYGTIFQDTEEHVDKKTKETKKAKLLEEVVKGKNVFDIFHRMEELNDAVVKAADEVAAARNEMKEAENARAVVQKEITEYQTILEAVKRRASVAVAPKNFSSDAAKETIRLYSENYVKKMNGDVMQKELKTKIEAKSNAALPKSIGKL